MVIYLILLLPAVLSNLPESSPGRFKRFLFGLASDGVCMCPACYQTGGSLLHCPSTLAVMHDMAVVYFCCTFLGVASTGRYPASCPVKPGLSSPAVFRHLQPRSSVLLIITFLFFILTTVLSELVNDSLFTEWYHSVLAKHICLSAQTI